MIMIEYSRRFFSSSSQGFTLIEMLTVTSLIGIMAAIAVPSLLGFVNRAQVEKEFSKLRAMLYLTQRNAMRNSESCTMFLPTNNVADGILTSNCSLTGSKTLENVNIIYNRANSKKVNFNFRGNTGSLRTIVVYSELTNWKRCMVISNGIGMMRSGVYTHGDLDSISAKYCQTTS